MKKFCEENIFQNPTSAILIAALEKQTGELWLDKEKCPKTAMLFTEFTCYIDGETVELEGIQKIFEWIEKHNKASYQIVLQEKTLEESMDRNLNAVMASTKYLCQKTERHLMETDLLSLDTVKLTEFVKEISEDYTVREIDAGLYDKAMQDGFLSNFVKGFKNVSEFVEDGFGYFLFYDGEIVGGVSCFVRYEKGVEVQIAIHPNHRGKHLARSLGAMFLLECRKRNLYPWWDCANPASERIAEQLGYTLKSVSVTYKIKEQDVFNKEKNFTEMSIGK